MMRCKSGKKPMSNMRSASSKIKICTWDKLAVFWVMWSSKRPGVAINNSTPPRNKVVCADMSTPPKTTAVRISVYLAYLNALSATWSANSRVGVSTKARIGWRAGDALLLAIGKMFCKIGKTKAAVLPVPVWAAPITSRPCSTWGIACAWIGVGVV